MAKGGKYSDENLIAGLADADGDILAYERIFHKYWPMVLNFIRGMLKDGTAAEDIAQNIFMKLWVNRMTLDSRLSLKNYLCVLAKNEVLNVLRSKAHTSLSFQPTVPEAPTRETEDWVSFSETNASIARNVDNLPPRRRMIFRLSRYGHLSNEEIALKLNLSVRTVEKHIELALKDLRKSMN